MSYTAMYDVEQRSIVVRAREAEPVAVSRADALALIASLSDALVEQALAGEFQRRAGELRV
jgi:hypothetical protein